MPDSGRVRWPTEGAVWAAIALGTAVGLVMLLLAALTAGDLGRGRLDDVVYFAAALVGGLALVIGATVLLLRLPAGRPLLAGGGGLVALLWMVVAITQLVTASSMSVSTVVADLVAAAVFAGAPALVAVLAVGAPVRRWLGDEDPRGR